MAKQWNDFGGPREQSFRKAVVERLRLNEQRANEYAAITAAAHQWMDEWRARIAEPQRAPPNSGPDGAIRARMSALANAPLRHREPISNASKGGDPRRTKQGTHQHAGVIATCKGNSGGMLRTRKGEQYAFAFVDLCPELKLSGVRDGMEVRFDMRERAVDGGIGRATNIRADE